MKIELKKIQFAAFASEETPCFSADVYVDGKLVAHVSNDGHGGSDNWYGAGNENGYDWQRRIDEYALTLPPHYYDQYRCDQTAETIVSDLFQAWQEERDARLRRSRAQRLLRTKTTYVRDGKCYTTKGLVAPERVLAKYPQATVLNTLPFEQAFAKLVETQAI